MNINEIQVVIDQQRAAVRSRELFFGEMRKSLLFGCKKMISKYEDEMMRACEKDLGRAAIETYISEIAIVYAEIDYALKNIDNWIKPEKVPSIRFAWRSRSVIYKDPAGVVLIIGTWNYPFLLSFVPLVNALAAGNSCILKPSEIAPTCSELTARMIRSTFSPSYVAAFEGNAEVVNAIIDFRVDHVFFTGSSEIGKKVMARCAQSMTPVSLECGGKNPCIVDVDTDQVVAARRIVHAKFFNAGQTCIAPDFLLVNSSIKDNFVKILCSTIDSFYTSKPLENTKLSHIISTNHMERLRKLIGEKNTVCGGEIDEKRRTIRPAIIDNAKWTDLIMQEEIFGPLLPVIGYDKLDDMLIQLEKLPSPLALYVFSNCKQIQEKVRLHTRSGTFSCNAIFPLVSSKFLPFGGIGLSGMGRYHGKAGFDTFSRIRSTLVMSIWPDFKLMYPPYKISVKVMKLFAKWLF